MEELKKLIGKTDLRLLEMIGVFAVKSNGTEGDLMEICQSVELAQVYIRARKNNLSQRPVFVLTDGSSSFIIERASVAQVLGESELRVAIRERILDKLSREEIEFLGIK